MSEFDRATGVEEGVAEWMDRISMAASYYWRQLRDAGLTEAACVQMVCDWHNAQLVEGEDDD